MFIEHLQFRTGLCASCMWSAINSHRNRLRVYDGVCECECECVSVCLCVCQCESFLEYNRT